MLETTLMATSFLDINKEIAKLQAQANKLKAKEVGGVVKRIREAIAAYNLTADDLGLTGKPGRTPKAVAAAASSKPARRGRKPRAAAAASSSGVVYTNGEKEWSGRGRRPAWILEGLAAGKSLDDFVKR